jgi:hypothetical protein
MRRRSFLAALALAPLPARAQGEIRPVPLREGEQLRGRFTQERQLQGFARPLRSRGAFLLLPGRGLIWRSEAPFVSMLVITGRGILQLQDGQEAMRLPAARAPGIGRFYEVLSGALSGDHGRLAQVFDMQQRADAAAWELRLTPLKADDPALAQIGTITVAGARLLESITVRKINGDTDLLAFREQQVTPAAPDAAEDALLRQLGV